MISYAPVKKLHLYCIIWNIGINFPSKDYPDHSRVTKLPPLKKSGNPILALSTNCMFCLTMIHSFICWNCYLSTLLTISTCMFLQQRALYAT